MTKKLLFLAVSAVGLTFASCKKDYTCTCITSVNGVAVDTTTTSFQNVKKNQIEAACSATSTSSFGGISATQTCSFEDN